MSKRTKVVIRTKESEALRKLRELRGLSVRKAGDLLGISHTMVNHLELGRANITEEHVQKYLKTLNYSEEEWKSLVSGRTNNRREEMNNILQECISITRSLPDDKLRKLRNLINDL